MPNQQLKPASINHSSESYADPGMDRPIGPRRRVHRRLGIIAGGCVLASLTAYGIYHSARGSRLTVEQDRIRISVVEEEQFQEYLAISGAVMPRTTVYLDAVEGGRVEDVFVEEGAMVVAGEPILRLSNSNLQLHMVQAEAQRIEQDNLLQNLRFQMEQNALNRRQQLTEMEYQILRLETLYDRERQLRERELISALQYEQTLNELRYWQRRRDLTLQAYRTDSLRQVTELARMQAAVSRMQQNFQVVEEGLENLTVRAPVSGQLSLLEADLGEIRPQGTRFGQIDVLDGGYVVRASIHEYYIGRISRDLAASTQPIGGSEHRMQITRVYPEVRSGRFEVDLAFVDAMPVALRRGQTIRLKLELGDPATAVVVPRGGFDQTTSGNWIYVVDGSGKTAERRTIRLGRQNPQYFEVLEGLRPGERVVTSSYEHLGDATRLILK